jgi:hypothetical protein
LRERERETERQRERQKEKERSGNFVPQRVARSQKIKKAKFGLKQFKKRTNSQIVKKAKKIYQKNFEISS